MERETWKNAGLAGAAVVALGCGAMWFTSRGEDEAVSQLVTTSRPVRVANAAPAPTRPVKPVVVASNHASGRRTREDAPAPTRGRRDRASNKPEIAKKGKPPAA